MAEEGLARGETEQDQQVAQAINERFIDDGKLDGSGIQVHVRASEATLTGDLDSQDTRDRVAAVTALVPGVHYVINNPRVRQEGTSGATG